MRGAVFAYHSQNCTGEAYSENDHIALENDLRKVQEFGLPILSLFEIASSIRFSKLDELPERFVGFSCDDGTLLDWLDYEHPKSGHQKSFVNIIRDFAAANDLPSAKLLTSFVIASADARKAIDDGCYEGAPLSDDDWWPDAAAEGTLAIENHSWDHLHPVLPDEMLRYGTAENFYSVDSFEKADKQVRAASQYINNRLSGTGCKTCLFAYPYGHASTYLSDSYLPGHEDEHGIIGAFSTVQGYVDQSSKVFSLPRFMCGDAWSTPEGFEAILTRMNDL